MKMMDGSPAQPAVVVTMAELPRAVADETAPQPVAPAEVPDYAVAVVGTAQAAMMLSADRRW